jgi:hypothetical protein
MFEPCLKHIYRCFVLMFFYMKITWLCPVIHTKQILCFKHICACMKHVRVGPNTYLTWFLESLSDVEFNKHVNVHAKWAVCPINNVFCQKHDFVYYRELPTRAPRPQSLTPRYLYPLRSSLGPGCARATSSRAAKLLHVPVRWAAQNGGCRQKAHRTHASKDCFSLSRLCLY